MGDWAGTKTWMPHVFSSACHAMCTKGAQLPDTSQSSLWPAGFEQQGGVEYRSSLPSTMTGRQSARA